MTRIRGYQTRAVIIEQKWEEIANGLAFANQRSRLTPNVAMGMIDGLIAYGVPVLCVSSRYAEHRAFNIMRLAYNRWVRKSKHFENHKELDPIPFAV